MRCFAMLRADNCHVSCIKCSVACGNVLKRLRKLGSRNILQPAGTHGGHDEMKFRKIYTYAVRYTQAHAKIPVTLTHAPDIYICAVELLPIKFVFTSVINERSRIKQMRR